MLAIVDHRAPKVALKALEREFETVLFKTEGITYDEISGHPDIFMYQSGKTIIIAENTPSYIFEKIRNIECELIVSQRMVGRKLEDSTYFNCSATESYFFHKNGFTAPEILALESDKKSIHLPQAYTRCTTSAYSDHCIVTSDEGVYKAMTAENIDALLIDPIGINLPGFRYGFFGGTNGWIDQRVYFLGNILKHPWGKELDSYLGKHGYEAICLSNGKLYDGGGIFFI